MDRVKLLSLVTEVCTTDASNDVIDALLDRLDDEVPHATISDLIYWSPIDLTPEQIVDEALRREAEWRRDNAPAAKPGTGS